MYSSSLKSPFQILFDSEFSWLFFTVSKQIIWGARFHSDISLDFVKNLRLINMQY